MCVCVCVCVCVCWELCRALELQILSPLCAPRAFSWGRQFGQSQGLHRQAAGNLSPGGRPLFDGAKAAVNPSQKEQTPCKMQRPDLGYHTSLCLVHEVWRPSMGRNKERQVLSTFLRSKPLGSQSISEVGQRTAFWGSPLVSTNVKQISWSQKVLSALKLCHSLTCNTVYLTHI